jgi:hypothetical protein
MYVTWVMSLMAHRPSAHVPKVRPAIVLSQVYIKSKLETDGSLGPFVIQGTPFDSL